MLEQVGSYAISSSVWFVLASYTGDDAREILRTESATILERLVEEKANGPHSSSWSLNTRSVLLLVADAIRQYDLVIVRTQKLNLHPQWQEAIDGFKAAHARLGDAYTALFPRRRGDDFMTPKVACVIFDVPRWINKYGWSLIVVNEQAFEAVHYEYMELEKLYKIPLTGAELIVGKRRWSSDPSWGQKSEKKQSKRTATKKKARVLKKAQKAPRKAKKSRRATSVLVNRYKRARELQRKSVAAFNAQNVASDGAQCIARMKEVMSYEKNPSGKPAPWRL